MLGFKGPRKMTVLIPAMTPDKQRIKVKSEVVSFSLVIPIAGPPPSSLTGFRNIARAIQRWSNDQYSQITQQATGMVRWSVSTLDSMQQVTLNGIFSTETHAYVLNFHGRVTQASVKNFQLVHAADGEIFQFI